MRTAELATPKSVQTDGWTAATRFLVPPNLASCLMAPSRLLSICLLLAISTLRDCPIKKKNLHNGATTRGNRHASHCRAAAGPSRADPATNKSPPTAGNAHSTLAPNDRHRCCGHAKHVGGRFGLFFHRRCFRSGEKEASRRRRRRFPATIRTCLLATVRLRKRASCAFREWAMRPGLELRGLSSVSL